MVGKPDDPTETAEGFEWDSGNDEKNWTRHGVRRIEAEQVLLNRPFVNLDVKHSQSEARLMALGETASGRLLTIVLTMRGARVRVISARPMSRAERKAYAEAQGPTEADS